MPLAYLLVENLRGLLWQYIERHNARRVKPIDTLRVGDAPNLPLGSLDPQILRWAEREKRILVSLDERSLAGHLAEHLAAGHKSPGIFIPRAVPLPDVIAFLICAAYAGDPEE